MKKYFLLTLVFVFTSSLFLSPAQEASAANFSKITVYRFYHYKTGSHFYTTSESEKERVITRMASTYRYEGYKFAGWKSSDGQSRVPVERFYNKNTGTHFYTISPTESARLKNTSNFRYEGIAYYGQKDFTATDDVYGQCPLVRFYNFKNKTHFYTTSYTEALRILDTMDDRYRYEGLGYVVWDGNCNW